MGRRSPARCRLRPEDQGSSGGRDTLDAWMDAVDTDLPLLHSFTAGLRRDLTPWSAA
jgi:hypothetical protein